MHHMNIHRARQDWKQATLYACLEKRRRSDPPVGTPLHPVYLRFTCDYKARRSRDVDNLIASFKPIIDGLVLANVLTEDDVQVVKGVLVDVRVDKALPLGVAVEVFHKEYTP
jgi:hypothetical protein